MKGVSPEIQRIRYEHYQNKLQEKRSLVEEALKGILCVLYGYFVDLREQKEIEMYE